MYWNLSPSKELSKHWKQTDLTFRDLLTFCVSELKRKSWTLFKHECPCFNIKLQIHDKDVLFIQIHKMQWGTIAQKVYKRYKVTHFPGTWCQEQEIIWKSHQHFGAQIIKSFTSLSFISYQMQFCFLPKLFTDGNSVNVFSSL